MGKTIQWKNGGKEDKFIEKLIGQGKINKYTKPSYLKENNALMFSQFSSNVVRNHLNMLKRNNGLYLNGESEDDEDSVVDVTDVNPKGTSKAVHDDPTSYLCSNIHQNYPTLVGTFKDPETQLEKVMVVVSLPGGAQNVKTELNDEGTVLFIKYSWPKPLFDMNNLFNKQLGGKLINLHHPKILCLQNELENVREHIDIAPESVITQKLPIKVQTCNTSWTKSGLKRDDGTQLILAELTGYVKNYNKKITDETVTFDS